MTPDAIAENDGNVARNSSLRRRSTRARRGRRACGRTTPAPTRAHGKPMGNPHLERRDVGRGLERRWRRGHGSDRVLHAEERAIGIRAALRRCGSEVRITQERHGRAAHRRARVTAHTIAENAHNVARNARERRGSAGAHRPTGSRSTGPAASPHWQTIEDPIGERCDVRGRLQRSRRGRHRRAHVFHARE